MLDRSVQSNQAPQGHQRGLHILAPMLGAYLALSLCFGLLIPAMQARYVPKDPPMPPLLSTIADPKLGSSIPEALRVYGLPLKVVVHIDCLSCSSRPLAPIKRLFLRNDIINVVVSDDKDIYREFASVNSNGRVLFAKDSLVKAMNVAFGPRLYIYDETGRLIYLQGLPGDSARELDTYGRQ